MQIQKDNSNNPKYARINEICQLLALNPEGLTISHLAEVLKVSTKTIQRDLHEVLSSYGVINEGRRWKLDKSLLKDNLQTDERVVLGILENMAKNVGSEFYFKAHHLLKQVSHQLDHPIYTSLESEKLNKEDIELFATLENAIKSKQEITCIYNTKEFHLKPLKLAYFDGVWYLLAQDIKKDNKFKKFHLKSINNLVLLEDTFEIDSSLEDALKKANSIWFDPDNQTHTVYLHVDKYLVKHFERKPLKSQVVVGKDKDGSIEIMLDITHEMEVLPLIYAHIPHIRVLKPKWLAKIVKKEVEGYLGSL